MIKIQIKKKGYVTFTSEISPKFSEISILDVKLEKKIDKINRLSKKEYSNSIGIKLKIFNPNSFTMGAPRHEKGQRANEFQRDVVLRKKFYVSLTEITVQDFMKYKNKSYSKKDKYSPIRNITWFEAVNFCNWLSDKEELGKVYNFQGKKYLGANLENNGYRLPTEAEWEYAARGGLIGKRYTWGDDAQDPAKPRANTWQGVFPAQDLGDDGFKAKPAPVGCFAPNGYGLRDMAGNVWEWTRDWFKPGLDPVSVIETGGPPEARALDPEDPNTPKHVVKGGSFLCADDYCFRYRPAARTPGPPDSGASHVGFRTVLRAER